MTTNKRSSLPAMMLRMAWRVPVIKDSTGVPWMGKKRIKCSGGGSTVMSLMRSSSVWLVLSSGRAYQGSLAWGTGAFMGDSLAGNLRNGNKKTAGLNAAAV